MPEHPQQPVRIRTRALITGAVLAAIFAALAPINDWLLHNTYLYSQHLPIGVFLLLVLLGVAINPLLGARRFNARESLIMVAMLLVVGGVASSGLNAYFPAIMAGPAKVIGEDPKLTPLVDAQGRVQVPTSAYLGFNDGRLNDRNDPEFRHLIDGFHDGLGSGDATVTHRARVTWRDTDGQERTQLAWEGANDGTATLDLRSEPGALLRGQGAGASIATTLGTVQILAVERPAIPWLAWLRTVTVWLPLLASAVICYLTMAALVRRQWMENERLPYPIAEVIVGFLGDPAPGSRFAALYRERWFWIAFAIAAGLLLGKGLHQIGVIPFTLPLDLDFWSAFRGTIISEGYAPGWMVLKPTIYISIVALVFFLPSEISFSLWFCFLAGNLTWAVLQRQGVPLDTGLAAKTSMGGWFMECVLILWIGRRYYIGLLRAAFVRSADPELAAMRLFTWAFLLSAAGLVLSMVAFGAYLHHACLAALCYIGLGLVLARLVAEAGIPFMQTPMLFSSVIYSLTGVTAPVAALIPLTMLGQTLCADPREHLLPFATNAEYLAERAGAPRRQWAGVALATVAGAALISGIVMLWCAYGHDGQKSLDSWWRDGPLQASLGPPAQQAVSDTGTWAAYAVGAGLTGACGLARLAWAWWPVHPIGILIAASNPIYHLWFSILLGCLAKVLVMRYGGTALYSRLKPAAMGLIAGEALLVGCFLIINLIATSLGHPLPPTRFLPW